MLLIEHVDTKVSRSRSTNQKFIRNLRSNQRSPAPCPTDHWRTYLQCRCRRATSILTSPMQRNTPSMIMNSHASSFITMYTSQESATMYSPFVPPEFIRMYSPQIHHDVRTVFSPSPHTTRMPANSSISIRGRAKYFVARSAVLVSVGCLRSRNAFSETFSCTQSHLTSRCFSRPQPWRDAIPMPAFASDKTKGPACASCALSTS